MNVLLVFANPRPMEESVSKQLATAFMSRLVEKNPDVDVDNVDLYQDPPPFLSLEAYRYFYQANVQPGYKPTKPETDAAAYALKQGERLRQTDVLAIALPMWTGGPPAILKAWLDQVMAPGVMFTMDDQGIKPLHQLRRVVLLVSSGDSYKESDPRDGVTPCFTNTFGFVGVTDIAVAWADGQDPRFYSDSAERRQNALEAAQDLADEIAELP
jgi:FMN-dependent NADH-azoreductase